MGAGAAEHDEWGDDDTSGRPTAEEIEAEEEARRLKATSVRAKGTPNWIQCLAGAPAHPSLVFTGSRDCAVRRGAAALNTIYTTCICSA